MVRRPESRAGTSQKASAVVGGPPAQSDPINRRSAHTQEHGSEEIFNFKTFLDF